ncbi:hypothetical protein Tco_0071528 [Tanacetum coccineum]
MDKEANMWSIQNIPRERNHTEIFPEDFFGLQLTRIVEFQIDLVPGAAPVAKTPYRLSPSELQELSRKLRELLSKGLIRLSLSLWSAPRLFIKKKDGSMRTRVSWDTYLPLVEFSYNNSYHTSINDEPFKALYGRKYRLPLCWLETVDRQLTRLDVIQETNDKITTIKERLKTTRSRQKSYVDNRRKPLEFQIGDQVLLKVLSKVGLVTYQLELRQKLRGIYDVFHVSNLKKSLTDKTLVVPLEELHITDKLQFIDKPLEIMDHYVKRPKHSRIPIVKVRWNAQRGLEFTWKREDKLKRKYPHLFLSAHN